MIQSTVTNTLKEQPQANWLRTTIVMTKRNQLIKQKYIAYNKSCNLKNWEFIIRTFYWKPMTELKKINKNRDFYKDKKKTKTKAMVTEASKVARRT